MAKVNIKAFHCIPLTAFAHNSHSRLSSRVKKMEDFWNRLSWFQAALMICVQTNWDGISNGRTPSFLLIHLQFFFSPDVPGGFCVKQQEEEAREGGDLHLTCLANKYLYAALSWQPVKESRFPAPIIHQHTTGNFSSSLVLLLSNLTARDSGIYRCSTRHLFTGKVTHLETQVVVTSKYSTLS